MFPLYTYGCTGGKIEDLKAYAAAGALILDIRLSPNSPPCPIGWRQVNLKHELGCSYNHDPALGNLTEGKGEPIEIKDLKGGLKRLECELLCQPVVLLCGCKSPIGCHRAIIGWNLIVEAVGKNEKCSLTHLKPGDKIDA